MNRQLETYDAIVVGAGPAGCAAAITMARSGLAVLLIDKHNFPRDKVCGDGLTGNSRQMLVKLGVWEKVAEACHHSPRLFVHPPKGSCYPLNINIYTLRRRDLDFILYQKALDLEVTFRQLSFTGERVDNDIQRIVCTDPKTGQREELEARFVVLATGSGPVPGDSGAKPADLIALRGYYRANWNLDAPRIIFSHRNYRNGYIWIFPVGKNLYNVGCGSEVASGKEMRQTLEDLLIEFNGTRQASGAWVETPRGAPLRTNLANISRAVQNSFLLAGDSLGCCFPVTGEGIAKSLETGILAGETICADIKNQSDLGLELYRRRLNRQVKLKFLPYRILASLLRFNFLAVVCRGAKAQNWFIASIRLCNRISLRLFERD